MFHRYAVAAGGAFSLVVLGLATFHLARRSRLGEPSNLALASQAKGDGGTKLARPADGKVSSGPPSMLHLDPRHTNRSPFAGPKVPNVLWTFDTGGPIQAAPAVLED